MNEQWKIIFNFLKKHWFFFLIGFIVIIFILNRVIAIWTTISLLIIFVIYYSSTLNLKNKIVQQIKNQYRLTDAEISEKFNRSLDEIREKMANLSKNQKKKPWLIVFLNKRYVAFNNKTVEKFIELYFKGFNEKQIHESLKKYISIKTRAEIKAIENTLISHNRLKKRRPLNLEINERKDKSPL